MLKFNYSLTTERRNSQYIHLFSNARTVGPCVFLFSEHLAGPFLPKVDSLDCFQRCADSDGLTFLNSTPFSLSVSIPAVDIVIAHIQVPVFCNI